MSQPTHVRVTPAEKKYRRVLAQHAQGASLDALARKHGVKRTTLVWWQSELRRRDRSRQAASAPLLPVRIDPTPVAQESRGFQVELPTGEVVRVPAGFDAGELRRLVVALERPTC